MANRLFLALPLPDGARKALQERLAAASGGGALPGRGVRPENWHFTLRFLGETPPDAIGRLLAALDAAPLGGDFAVGLGALGAFPRPARASVLWVGVDEGAAELLALAREVEAAVRAAGLPAEERAFAAHLTLSRLQPPRDLRALLERTPAAAVRFRAQEVVLYRSHLGVGPPRYERLHSWRLG